MTDKPPLEPFEKALLFMYAVRPPEPLDGNQIITILGNLCFDRDHAAALEALKDAKARGLIDQRYEFGRN